MHPRLDKTLTGTAVVGTLRTGETALGPAEGRAVSIEECVLLLNTEPRDRLLGEVHDLLGVVAEIGHIRGAVAVVRLGEDENVVAATEGVLEDRRRTEVDVGIVAGSLVCRRAVEVPDAELLESRVALVDSLHASAWQ